MGSILINDSIAIVCKDGMASSTYPHLIRSAINVNLQPHGTSGLRICRLTHEEYPFADMIPSGLGDFRGDVDRLKGIYGANQVIIALGQNDKRPINELIDEYRGFVTHLINTKKMEVILLTPLKEQVEGLTQAILDLATERGILGINSGLLIDLNDPDNFVLDHLSVLGHSRYAGALMSLLIGEGRWNT